MNFTTSKGSCESRQRSEPTPGPMLAMTGPTLGPARVTGRLAYARGPLTDVLKPADIRPTDRVACSTLPCRTVPRCISVSEAP